MSTLQLSLKRKWFDMTSPEEKSEDYRDITPYWCNRLILVDGQIMTKKWWQSKFSYSGKIFTDNNR